MILEKSMITSDIIKMNIFDDEAKILVSTNN